LERYRTYADDWDGQGAKAIPAEVVGSAVELVALLRSNAIAPATCVLPGFGGTVGFEWDTPGGGSTKLEVTGPETAEFERFTPDGSYESLRVGDPVTA
jgi:hypothetical protein